MKPQRFERSNKTYTKPKGWKEEDCHDVQAFEGKDEVGTPVVITCWKPTDAERTKIAAGEPVWLVLYGGGMQPAIVTADDPWQPK